MQKFLPFLIVLFFFLGCSNENNPEVDMNSDKLEKDDLVFDEENNVNEDEVSDNDGEIENYYSVINTSIVSNNSGMYIAGHTRDKEHGGGYDYAGFVKEYKNNKWEVVYECGGAGMECATTKQSIWLGVSGEVVVAGLGGLLFFNNEKWDKKYFSDGSVVYCLWGISFDNIFAVGKSGILKGVIFHFDGTEIKELEIQTEGLLKGIWGTALDNVYAVGENGTILHYNGSEWSVMESGANGWLNAIWGSGEDNIYVVGENVILHFNGQKWIETLKDEKSFFIGVHGLTSDSILAVGRTIAETPEAIVFHYNGQRWNKIETNIKSILFDVLAMPDGSFYVVGDNNTIERITP